MPSIWGQRKAQQQHKMHKRSAASITTLNNIMAGSTGLFDEFGMSIGVLVDCYLEVQVIGLRSNVSLRILFRNTSGQYVRNAIFRASTVDGASMALAECYVDVDEMHSTHAPGLEYRDITNLSHQASMLECQVGSVDANRDCVIFLRYQHNLAFEDDTAIIRFPLPGRRGEKLIARQKNKPGVWNASQIFSFIAIDIQVAEFPGKITNVSSSSHSIQVSAEESAASIELDDYSFQGQDEVLLRVFSEPLDLDKWPADSYDVTGGENCSEGLKVQLSERIMIVESPPTVDSLEGSISQIMHVGDNALSPTYLLPVAHQELPTQRFSAPDFEEANSKLFQFSGTKSLNVPPPDVSVEHLYSDIWEVNEARMSYSSEESTASDRNSRIRRRKTTVHKKYLSNASSEMSNMSEISWLDDASDDEVNDEAERIFEEFSVSRSRKNTIDSAGLPDDYDLAECQSIRIVRPTRPKLIEISPKIPHMSLDNFTPPQSPIKQNRQSMELLRELDNILDNLNYLLEDSPTPYLVLNQEFATTLGLQLRPLKAHIGAQAHNLHMIPFWIREGIWANAITLQFLSCVMDSPFFKTLHKNLRVEYRLLYNIIESAFSSHGQHLSPSARMNRFSDKELLDLAAGVIQDLADGEDNSTTTAGLEDKQVDVNEYVNRPISPPKTPDEDDRKHVNVNSFVNCFEFESY